MTKGGGEVGKKMRKEKELESCIKLFLLSFLPKSRDQIDASPRQAVDREG